MTKVILLRNIRTTPNTQAHHLRAQVRLSGSSIQLRRQPSMSRPLVIATEDGLQNHRGADVATISDETRMSSEEDDSSDTTVAELLSEPGRMPRTLYHSSRSPRERKRPTSRGRDVRLSHSPASFADQRQGSAVALRRPPLHIIHTNRVPPLCLQKDMKG